MKCNSQNIFFKNFRELSTVNGHQTKKVKEIKNYFNLICRVRGGPSIMLSPDMNSEMTSVTTIVLIRCNSEFISQW